MKRQKRDRLGRAYSSGYQAGINGKGRDNCPYQDVNIKAEWLGGWREGVSDKNAGIFK